MSELPDYAVKNQAHWNLHADWWVEGGEHAWSSEPYWGMWRIPESELGLLPADLSGVRSIELGCGTGYVSGWLARRGASVVGIDLSERQLETARRLADEHGVEIELHHGNAEEVPFPDASFDLAVSEYGAAIWCDPRRWIPEAHRLLRTGGRLLFLGTHPLATLTLRFDIEEPTGRTLLNRYFGMHRVDWSDPDGDEGTEFNLTISDWMKLFHDTGFDIVGYHEIQAPEPGPEVRFFTTAEWSHDYPSEQVWDLRKR